MDTISALSKVIGIIAVALDRGGVLSTTEFVRQLNACAEHSEGTERAILKGLASGIEDGSVTNNLKLNH
jgi:hypothetical protein